jgi:hypothetical protein
LECTFGLHYRCLVQRASFLKLTGSPCLRFLLCACELTGCGSYSLTYLLYNIMQCIIMLVSLFVLVWLMTPITRGRCCRHLVHGKFLTTVMSFVMDAGEARPFSQPSTGWNMNFWGTATFYTFFNRFSTSEFFYYSANHYVYLLQCCIRAETNITCTCLCCLFFR